MIERFLTDVLGIPWDEVHEEAERIEHAMSPVLEERMRAAIGDATTCPHGHPIVEGVREQGSLLADVEVGAEVTVLRFENEAEELLHYLKRPGCTRASRARSRAPTTRASQSPPPTASTRSAAASPRPSRSAPTRRRRRERRSPSSWCSPRTATAARQRASTLGSESLRSASEVGASLPPAGSVVTITDFDAVHVAEFGRGAAVTVGYEQRLDRFDFAVALNPGLEHAVLGQLLDVARCSSPLSPSLTIFALTPEGLRRR